MVMDVICHRFYKRVRLVGRGTIYSELLICSGGVRSILSLPLVVRCLETLDVYICRLSSDPTFATFYFGFTCSFKIL